MRCPHAQHRLELSRMSDIFLSYVVYDTEKAHKLSALFKQQGWTVWAAPPILPPGMDYAEVVERELKSAKVIVALWSLEARHAATVREDLKRGASGHRVIVLLDSVRPPFKFFQLPEFDLSGWDGASSHAQLHKLFGYLRANIVRSSPAAPPASFEGLPLSKIRDNARLGIQESMRSRPESGAQFKGVFISYRRDEAAAYARGLYDRLTARFGQEKVFLDVENVGWGEDFVEVITSAAESCAVMIVLVSRQWARGRGGQEGVDDYVRLEVAKALGRRIRVIPILIQGASMPAPKELTEDLAPLVRRNALALSDTRWERDVEDLMKTLEGLLKD